MNERDFIYWLQGFLEVSKAITLDEKQVQIIKDHIKQVVIKVTPSYSQAIPMSFSMPPRSDTIIC